MDHMMMHVDQHHDNLEDQCSNQQQDASSTSVSVSRVAFVLAAIAFLSMASSSFAFRTSSGAARTATQQLLAALCGVVTTKKALFIFSNVILFFLAADCRCFFGIVCAVAPSKSDDHHHTASELPPCAVQAVQPCASYSGYTTCAPWNCSEEQEWNCSEEQERRQDTPVSSMTPESFRLEGDGAKNVALETVVVVEDEVPTCGGVPQELEKLEIHELNRKFEEFIQSRRITWIKEEEVLQRQQV